MFEEGHSVSCPAGFTASVKLLEFWQSSGMVSTRHGFSMSKRFSTFEESPPTTPGTFCGSQLWTSSSDASYSCYVPHHSGGGPLLLHGGYCLSAFFFTDFPSWTTPAFSLEVAKHGVLAFAQEEFSALERLGIVRRSKSPWASPLHMVLKADGTWRLCGWFRCLTNVTTPDRDPIPHIHGFSIC